MEVEPSVIAVVFSVMVITFATFIYHGAVSFKETFHGPDSFKNGRQLGLIVYGGLLLGIALMVTLYIFMERLL